MSKLSMTGRPGVDIVCSTRSLARGPLWKGRKLGREAILTVQGMKRAKGQKGELEQVLQSQFSRLLKADMLQVLTELHRQNECALAYEVFKLVRKEMWYKPDTMLYSNMMNLLGQNARIQDVESLFAELQKEMFPDSLVYSELMTAYLRCQRPLDAIQTFEEMKQLGFEVSWKTYNTLIKGLEKKGFNEQAAIIKAECETVYARNKHEIAS